MFTAFLVVILAADSINSDIVEPAAGPGAKVPLETVKGGDPKNAPGPVALSPVAVFEIDDGLFGKLVESQSVAAPALRGVMYSTSWCPNCPKWEQYLGSLVEVRKVAVLPDGQSLAPALRRADGSYWDWKTAPTRETFAAWLSESAPQAVPALAGGTFDKAIVEKYIGYITTANIQGRLPRETLSLSGAEITLNGGAATVVHANGVATATFSAPLPEVKYGFLAIEVSGVVYNAGTLTAQLKSFPDVTFRGR